MTNTFSKTELVRLQSARTPALIQTLLNEIPVNFERNGKDTIKSPLRVLRENSAHCIEAALLGAYTLSLHGHKPLLVHLEVIPGKKNGKLIDYDHVIAPFKVRGLWGALSKSNRPMLRYRDPVYRNLRELTMSYFHEYVNDDGLKTLRRYSRPLNLNSFENDWPIAQLDLWGVDEELDRMKHYELFTPASTQLLRKADPIELKAGALTEWGEGKI